MTDYEKFYESLVQALIDKPPDPNVVRHMIGLLKALNRWQSKLSAPHQARPAQQDAVTVTATLASSTRRLP